MAHNTSTRRTKRNEVNRSRRHGENLVSHDAQQHHPSTAVYLSLSSALSFWWNGHVNKPNTTITATRAVDTTETPTSDLYDACLEMNWDGAVQLCRTESSSTGNRRSLAKYQEGDNLETPLYVACQNQPPLHLIQTLLSIWPEATITKSRQGDLPIHIACRYDAHISVIRALVQCNASTATFRTRFGTTPLIALWEPYCRVITQQHTNSIHRTNNIMASLVITNPTLYASCVRYHNCYSVLMDRSVSIDEKCQLVDFLSRTSNSGGQSLLDNDGDNTKWSITLELIKAVMDHRVAVHKKSTKLKDYSIDCTSSSSTHSCIVHATIAFKSSGCPIWVLFYVTIHYTYQYTIPDETGRLPLHIAVGPENSFTNTNNTTTTGSVASSPSSSQPQQHWKFIPREYWSIRLSLHFYPESILMHDPNEPDGRYPLHTAIYYRHQWSNGIRLLVQAAPHLLHYMDPAFGLYPFQLAGTICYHYHESSQEGLDLIYELIRYDPTVVQICRNEGSDETITAVEQSFNYAQQRQHPTQ